MGGRKQLTNEDIDKRIKDRNLGIKRVSDYSGKNSDPMEWECLVDGYRWKSPVSNLNRTSGCPKCGGHLPLTNALIDEKLTNRNIKRISDYPGKNSDYMEWECLVDGYKWKTTACIIRSGRGCPKCGGNLPLTNEIIDERLNGRNIRRLSEYTGSVANYMEWECLLDGHRWEQLPALVLSKTNRTNCPKCSGKAPLTNEDVDKLFLGTNFVRKSNFIDTTKKIEILCTKHNVIFSDLYNGIKLKIKKGTGCYLCSREKMRLSNEIIDKRLEGRNIKRIGNYTTANLKIEFQTDDGYKWFATPASVLFHTNHIKTRRILSNEIIDKRLEGRNIKRIGDFIESEKYKNSPRLRFLCTVCSHEWVTAINGVIVGETGCPNCKYGKSEKHFRNFIKENLEYTYFKPHKVFEINGRKFYPDFYIEQNDRKIIVEYNGAQHYKPIEYFGGETKFIQQVQRDNALKKFCQDNDIEFIEIRYDINKKDAEDLLIEKIGGRKFP
jgi:hypothetical protein